HPLRPRSQGSVHLRDQRGRRFTCMGPARPSPPRILRLRQGRLQDTWVALHPCLGQRWRTSLHGQVVGAGGEHRLRAHLRQPVRRLRAVTRVPQETARQPSSRFPRRPRDAIHLRNRPRLRQDWTLEESAQVQGL
ncbi:uncharacterized protein METZ01_LOCUS448880, partial [marine metagenome]